MSAVAELPELRHVITTADELTQRIADWKAKGFHVLSPAHQMTALPPNYGVIATAMFIKTEPDAKECYSDGTLVRGSDRALTRTGIKKIEQLAGISWLPAASRRTDPRTVQHFWEYESWCGLVGYDGQPRTQKGTTEVDLRDGSAQIGGWTKQDWIEGLAACKSDEDRKTFKIGGWTEKRVLQARQFGLRLAEAKSESAAVRAALGLKSSYRMDELQHPFVVLKVTFIPDYTDPAMRHLMAARASQGVSALYAAGASVAPFVPRELPPAQPSAAEVFDESLLNVEQPKKEPVPVPVAAGPTIPVVAPTPAPAPKSIELAQPPSPKPVSREQIKDAVDQSQQRANAPVPAPTPAPLPANTVYVEHYSDEKKPKRAGGTYIKATVQLSDGRELVTVYGPFRDRLKEARDARTPLIIDDKPSDYGNERDVKQISDARAPQDVPLPIPTPGAPVKL